MTNPHPTAEVVDSTTRPAPVVPTDGRLTPLGIDQVTIRGGFWGERQRLNAEAIIPHALRWETRVGWIDNFARARAGDIAARHAGREFADSDVYKLIEAMAWEVGRTGDAAMDAEIERIGELLEAVQRDDGYLNTQFGGPGQAPRYSDLAWGHELYCFGHLIQAGVARLRTGRDGVVARVARKAADHVCREFADGARPGVCGHPEIEVALAELARATGDARYLDQARRFVDRRGHGLLPDTEFGRSYYQDDEPFRASTVLRGHSVRALYLCAAAVDIAVESGDAQLLEAARRQYDATLATRTYLTGGMGAHHQDEAFGDDYELPPDRAYCETCAGVASVMVAWRLLLATGEPDYADVIERTLYNLVAASPSATGDAFFYTNTLHLRSPAAPPPPDVAVPRAASQLRGPWFEVSCCPTNVARTFATLATFVATATSAGVQLHQYVPATIATGAATIEVDTAYPDAGEVRVRVVDAAAPLALDLRIPRWAVGATVDGRVVSPGTHRVPDLRAGDVVELVLPIQPRVTVPDRRIDAVRGAVAVERGPLVLCVESVDLPGGVDVGDIELVAPPTVRTGESGVTALARVRADRPGGWPYGAADGAGEDAAGAELEIPLTPYHAWGNRGPTTMRVWLPVG